MGPETPVLLRHHLGRLSRVEQRTSIDTLPGIGEGGVNIHPVQPVICVDAEEGDRRIASTGSQESPAILVDHRCSQAVNPVG